MRRLHPHPRRKREQGVVITLVAVFMASVVIVMAALAIDLTTLYTARSEAQLAADSAALAGARVLANSGMTSSVGAIPLSTTFDIGGAESLATAVAVKVAQSNEIGGKAISGTGACPSTGISVCFNDTAASFISNPHVTVRVTRPDLPTFFLRFWSKQLAVAASATAEAYNPSGLSSTGDPAFPVAPVCVKPWLLPNLDPTQTTTKPIFDRLDGTIQNPNLIGQEWPNLNPVSPTNPSPNPDGLYSQPYGTPSGPANGKYYGGEIAGAANDFNVPTTSLPACSSTLGAPYQLAVAGCVPNPIPCGQNATVIVHAAPYPLRDADTVAAVQCLTHYNNVGDTDSMVGETTPPALPPASITPPFEFLAGNQNPIATAQGKHILVSDSLVTIPVYDSTTGPPNTQTVTVIGFLQVFLNPQSATLPYVGPNSPSEIPATIINQIGCGLDSSGTPIYGNGPSAVPVRLITPP